MRTDKEWKEFNKNKEKLFFCMNHLERAAKMLENVYNKMDFVHDRAFATHMMKPLDECYNALDYIRAEIAEMNQEYYKEVITRRENNAKRKRG